MYPFSPIYVEVRSSTVGLYIFLNLYDLVSNAFDFAVRDVVFVLLALAHSEDIVPFCF